MKSVKSTIAILYFFAVSYTAIAQNPVFSKGDFSAYIENFLVQRQSVQYDTLCIRSCAFVSFIVSVDGKVDSVMCNSATPKSLSSLFTSAVESTNGLWIATSKQRLLLPVAYLLECKKKQAVANKTQQSVLQMIDFSGKTKKDEVTFLSSGNMDMLNCIVLKPVFFRSPVN
jgi:hypothetical protein